MGDWATVTWWGIGSTRPGLPDHFGDERQWGVRCGWAAPGLWQLDSVTKYGWVTPNFGRPRQWLFVAPGYGQVQAFGVGPLQLGLSYVQPLPARTINGYRTCRDRPPTPGREVIREAAALLDGATVVDEARQATLCLAEVVPLDRAETCWPAATMPTGPLGLVRLVEAITLATPIDEVHRFVAGLWTSQFGYLHLGGLTIDMRARECSLRLGGAHHPVVDERRAGPCQNLLEFQPVALPAFQWPFT